MLNSFQHLIQMHIRLSGAEVETAGLSAVADPIRVNGRQSPFRLPCWWDRAWKGLIRARCQFSYDTLPASVRVS